MTWTDRADDEMMRWSTPPTTRRGKLPRAWPVIAAPALTRRSTHKPASRVTVGEQAARWPVSREACPPAPKSVRAACPACDPAQRRPGPAQSSSRTVEPGQDVGPDGPTGRRELLGRSEPSSSWWPQLEHQPPTTRRRRGRRITGGTTADGTHRLLSRHPGQLRRRIRSGHRRAPSDGQVKPWARVHRDRPGRREYGVNGRPREPGSVALVGNNPAPQPPRSGQPASSRP